MRTVSQSRWQQSASLAASIIALGVLVGLAPHAAHAVACVGDCDGSGDVDVSEITKMVNISLGTLPLSACEAGDADGSGDITVDEIIQAVNHALNNCPTGGPTPTPTPGTGTPVCGDHVVQAPEECDDGGNCIGGDNAGTACTKESDCHGNGVCIGGIKVGTSCASAADCPSGSCVHCRTFGGDGCASNCTTETTVDYKLVPGVTQGLTIKPGTSGAVVHGDVLTIPLAITGDQKITIGKAGADGTVPFIIKASSVVFPEIPVSTLACACVRGVAFKTCGGTLFNTDGTQTSSCTDGFGGEVTCPANLPCAFVHGDGNSATGTLGCSDAGLDGVDVNITQNSGGESGTPGLAVVSQSGHGAKGSAILLNSTAIGTVVGACSGFPNFCTDADPVSQRGQVQTLPFVTGTASSEVDNANQQDDVAIGPFSITGSVADCSKLTQTPPSTSGFATVGAFPALGQPTLGDIVVTNGFTAQ